MKRLLAFTGALLLCATGFSQTATVTWKTDVQQKNDTLYTIVFTGRIADGYHTYGTVTEMGYPAGIEFAEGSGYTAIGSLYDLGTKEDYEGEMVCLQSGERFIRSSILLEQQMRISAGDKVIEWIDDLAAGRRIGPIPRDIAIWKNGKKVRDAYDIKVFSSPVELFLAIKEKAQGAQDKGLSRVLATYDWAYKGEKSNPESPDGMWDVELHLASDGTWKMGLADGDDKGFKKGSDKIGATRFCHPWNYCLVHPSRSNIEEETAWAEKPDTINEIGSTYTIQGFDLNYAGVIIGPSVKFRDGKICFDASSSKNAQATNKRNGTLDYSQTNLRNELSVLLKRGVHGLYLFAVDPELQAELLKAQEAGRL